MKSPGLPLLLMLSLLLVQCTLIGESPSPSVVPSPSAQLTPVRLLLGFQPDVQFAPFYLAQQEGYYRDAGLDVSIEYLNGPDLLRLVADGDAQFGVADATDVMIARTSGIPVKYVSTLYQYFPVALVGAAGTIPADRGELAGTRIGTPGRFGSSWHALLAILASADLTADDVTIREYPQFNQVDGLLHGDVDFITGFRNNEPLRLEAAGMNVELLTIDEIAPLPGPGVVVGDDLLGSDPELVWRFTDATAKAQQAIVDDPQVGLRAAERAVPTIRDDEATALAVLEATIPIWLGPAPLIHSNIQTDIWQFGYDTMLRLGFIDGSVPLEDMFQQEPDREV